MRILLTLLAVCSFSVFLNACNTIEGAGEDLQAGGDAVSDTARDAKN